MQDAQPSRAYEDSQWRDKLHLSVYRMVGGKGQRQCKCILEVRSLRRSAGLRWGMHGIKGGGRRCNCNRYNTGSCPPMCWSSVTIQSCYSWQQPSLPIDQQLMWVSSKESPDLKCGGFLLQPSASCLRTWAIFVSILYRGSVTWWSLSMLERRRSLAKGLGMIRGFHSVTHSFCLLAVTFPPKMAQTPRATITPISWDNPIQLRKE